jgi:FMN reductase
MHCILRMRGTAGVRLMTRPFVLGVGGTLRAGSSSEQALAHSLNAAAACGAATELISGFDLDLPFYAPGAGERSAAAGRLVAALRRCDAVIIASPSYHGSVSGVLKNALDYLEDLSGDPRPYLDGRGVGLIACGAGCQGANSAMAALRDIVHALRGWPTPLGATLNTQTPIFDGERCTDPSARFQLETVGRQAAEFAFNWRRAAMPRAAQSA